VPVASTERGSDSSRARWVREVSLPGHGVHFGEVLALCAAAGLARAGVVAVDGTKVHANASRDATRDYELDEAGGWGLVLVDRLAERGASLAPTRGWSSS
jgi:hypothetical protein